MALLGELKFDYIHVAPGLVIVVVKRSTYFFPFFINVLVGPFSCRQFYFISGSTVMPCVSTLIMLK